MLSNNVSTIYRIEPSSRLRQGDIYKQVVSLQSIIDLGGELNAQSINLQYAVILSQDCDLEQDFNSRQKFSQNINSALNQSNNSGANHDKFLLSILLCPAYQIESFKLGEHLLDIGFKMQGFDKKRIDKLIKNEFYRYHYLHEDQRLNVPALVLDFKHYITLPRDTFYSDMRDKYVASINALFRENISYRFCHYLSRVGLPDVEIQS